MMRRIFAAAIASCLVAAVEVVVPSLALNSTVLEVDGSVFVPVR